MTIESTLEKKAKEAGYKFLGWENYFGWENGRGRDMIRPSECREEKHPLETDNHGTFGTDHTYVCHTCKIYWKLDSGD